MRSKNVFGTYHDSARLRNFTLVELLVSIAVIAILAGLMLPVLATAKNKVSGADCINNLRQLQLAFGMYADDFNGIFPCQKFVRPDGAASYTQYWLDDVVKLYLDRKDASEGNIKVLRCPKEKPENKVVTNYGLNYIVALGYTNESLGLSCPAGKLGLYSNPSKTSILVENYGHSCYYFESVNYNKAYDAVNAKNNRAAAFRHLNRASSGFVDGHVTSLAKRQLPCSESYPSFGAAPLLNTYFNMGVKNNSRDTIPGL